MNKTIALGILVFFTRICASGQSLTGTWQGEITDDESEFLQINIIQTGDKLCGYTWDYVYDDPASHCKAYFTGTLNKATNSWFLDGSDFIENSGTHVLMQIIFSVKKTGTRYMMTGSCRAKPESSFLSFGEPSPIKLFKVSKTPATITARMTDCVAANKPGRKPPVVRSPAKKGRPAPARINPPSVMKPMLHATDTTQHLTVAPPIVPADNPPPVTTAGRNNKEFREIIVHQRKIRLFIYDDGEVDGDSISVFYNNRIILSHARLTEKPITLDVTLDENISSHSIVLFAENLGSIPPNTALIIFTDDSGKRYELRSSATLHENAEFLFHYEP